MDGKKATMQVCGGRDEDTRLGVSFDMQGGLFLCACGGTGGDARVGRRAVSSDTAM